MRTLHLSSNLLYIEMRKREFCGPIAIEERIKTTIFLLSTCEALRFNQYSMKFLLKRKPFAIKHSFHILYQRSTFVFN